MRDTSLQIGPDDSLGGWDPPPVLPGPVALELDVLLGCSPGRAVYAATLPRPLNGSAVVEFLWGEARPEAPGFLSRPRFVVDLGDGYGPGWPSAALVTFLPACLPGKYGSFSLCEFIGAGGMGQVWQVTSPEFPDTPLAVKFFTHPAYNEDSLREQFFREASLGLVIDNPYVVRTYLSLDLRAHAREWWPALGIVMARCVPSLGQVLDHLRKNNLRLPGAAVLAFIGNLLDALGSLHGRYKVVHRDLKPSNVLLRFPHGKPYRGPDSLLGATAALSDLGTACHVGERPLLGLRQDGWKAPELFLPSGEPNLAYPASDEEDLYGFGKLLRVLLERAEDPGLTSQLQGLAEGLTAANAGDRRTAWARLKHGVDNRRFGTWRPLTIAVPPSHDPRDTLQQFSAFVDNPADEGAWKTFAERCGQRLNEWALARGLPREDAVYVVQSVLQRLYTFPDRIDAGTGQESFREHLRRMVDNAIVDLDRDRPSGTGVDVRGGREEVAVGLLEALDGDGDLSRAELLMAFGRVRKEVEKDEGCWEVFRLTTPRAQGGEALSLKEAAECLGLSLTTVYRYKYKVTSLLRDELRRLSGSTGEGQAAP